MRAYASVGGARRGGHAPYKNSPCLYFYLRKVESDGHSCPVENQQETPRDEDFAQLLVRLRAERGGMNDSDLARAIGVSPATISTWVHRRRSPSEKNLEAIAEAFPSIPRRDIFEAAKRTVPGKLTPDKEQRIMDLIRGLTAEQQEFMEAQLRGLNDANRS